MKRDTLLEKADHVNRRDRDKKAQPKEHTYRWDVKLTPFGTPSLNLSKPDRTGVEVTVRIRRRMKVQLRNEMLVQCSSEFFVTLLIAADEDCLVQSKRTATKYIIFFWYCQQQLFSHN
jgi:hypothetical protein